MLQRQLSSFDIKTIVDELQVIKDNIIEKSYQVSQKEIIIKIKNIQTKKKEVLFIRNGEFLTVTDQQFTIPPRPSNFVMALRKYVQNGRILEIFQHEFDRIIKIQIGKKTGTYTLIIEFFSEGNIILIDPDGKIIIPFFHQSWAHRKVKGRQQYLPPPSQINPFTISSSQFNDIIKESNADIVRTLAVKLNLSGLIAEEICLKSEIDKKKQASVVLDSELERLYLSLKEFLINFEKQQYQPVLIKKDETFIDILPFPFESYQNTEMLHVDHFIKGLSTFIKTDKKKHIQEQSETKTDKTIGKLTRMLKQQQEKVVLLDEKINQKKREGELIYLHYKTVDSLLNTVQKFMNENKKIESIETINIIKTFDPKKNKLIISLTDTNNTPIDIPLLFRKSVSENAEHAYDESKKSLKKKHGAELSIKKTKETLQKIHSDKQIEEKKLQEQNQVNKKNKKHFWFEQYRWTISSDGNLILGGKDVKTNEQLIKKHMEKQDRYVHADIHGAPSCIVKQKTLDEKTLEISDETLNEACMFAACYSRAWKQFSEAQSYWVLPQQVSKTPQSGEFVPKGAFIIRGKRNYCKCILEIGIGKITVFEETRWIGGSINAIKKWCDTFVTIKPGGMSRKDLSHLLAKKTDANSDNINQILPPGGVSIINYHGITLDIEKGDRV